MSTTYSHNAASYESHNWPLGFQRCLAIEAMPQ
jgi:hypothetical protein